jgi:Cu(I)/Ag(I) efflux system membrane fusion protein
VEIVEGLDAGDVVVTSSQFLIDSESNLDEALKRFQQQKAAIQPVFGQGVVRSVDVQNHQITLAHEPIEVLGWPAMTMDFDVSDNIELSVDLVGKTIHFALRKHEERYVIEQIHVMDTPDLQPAESADHEMKQHTEHKHEHADSGHEHGGHQHD